MTALKLALRLLRRGWRAGELRVLAVAVVVAVAAVSAVGLFTDRVGQMLLQQGGELLGGDLRLASGESIGEWARRLAESSGVRWVDAAGFVSMVQVGERMQLADVKAVGAGYPLRGELRTANQWGVPGTTAQAIPPPGSVWVAPRLAQALALQVGDTVGLGVVQLRVGALITDEPGRAGELFSLAPRVLMNLSDLPRTQLVQPGSRIRYELLMAGEPERVDRVRRLLTEGLEPGQKLEGVRDARPEVRSLVDRAGRMLGLAALSAVLVAGIAMAMAARRHAARQVDACALLRCMGATQAFITTAFAAQMLILGLAAGAVGALAGVAAQHGLAVALHGLIPQALPAPSWMPVGVAMLTGLVGLFGFALPPLLRLRSTPALRVLRRELDPPGVAGWVTYAAATVSLIGLVWWQAGDAKLTLYVWAGTGLTLVLLALAAFAMLGVLRGFAQWRGRARFIGLAHLHRRAAGSAAQTVAMGLGIMMLLLVSEVVGDLLDAWQQRLPPDAPNRFLINIQESELQPLATFFQAQGLREPAFYPMVRARLVAVNGDPVDPDAYQDPRARRLIQREFNLSWAAKPGEANRVTAGQWWGPAQPAAPMFSVEEGIADTLGIRLGDRLTYRLAGMTVTGPVTSLREVDWESFRVNFFVLLPPGVLEAYPKTYVTSFYLPERRIGFLNALVQAFPSVSVIDVDSVIAQVRLVLDHAVQALQFVFAFTLACGIVVLYAAIQSAQDERRRESAVLRALGASQAQLVRGWVAELALLGTVAGAVGALGAVGIAYGVAEHLLGLRYQPSPSLWVVGPLGGAVLVTAAGLPGLWRLLRVPALDTLRTT